MVGTPRCGVRGASLTRRAYAEPEACHVGRTSQRDAPTKSPCSHEASRGLSEQTASCLEPSAGLSAHDKRVTAIHDTVEVHVVAEVVVLDQLSGAVAHLLRVARVHIAIDVHIAE